MNITYPINALPRAIPLCLGVQSEYGARPISIDVSEWVGRWPDIIVSVQPVRPGEDVSYPAAGVTRSGNIVTWTPNAYDTEIPGTGSVEIIGLADGVKIIRTGAATTIAPTKSSVSKAPEEPMAAWADSVIRAGEQAKSSAEEALLLAQAANKSANNANASAVQAQSSQRAAATSASQAATYRTDAVGAMNAAKNSQTQAKASEQAASTLANAAYKSQQRAEAAAKRAEDAANSMGGGTVSPGDGKLKADAIMCDKSGEVVSIADASEMDALSVVSHIDSPEGVTEITLTRTGKNIWGGMALAQSIASQVDGAVLDVDAKTVTYDAGKIKAVNVFDKFELGKRYTVIFARDESKSKGTTANIRIIYDTGEALNISFNSGNPAVVTTAANKNVEKLLGYNSSGSTCLLYEQCGVFEGVLTAEDFVPSEAETFTVTLPEAVTDGTFEWATGVLTINQDGTSRTVQLDAKPIAMRNGYNTMWSSTGQTDVRYVADTKAYVDGHGADSDAEYADNAGYAEEAGDAQTVKGRDIAAEVDTLSKEIAGVEPHADDIPRIYFGASIPQNKNETVMKFRYASRTLDFDGYCETKAQGNSSMAYPKKNQTTKLFDDLACSEKHKIDFKGWGMQNKFCLKANWIDLTHARNVVSARLWGDVVHSRAGYDALPELMRTSPNYGAVDGFPVRVFANGVYQGRYTLNIPKDKWMANMDDENPNHCILCGENYVSGCFRAEAKIDGSDWTDEVHDVVPDNIKTRWNQVINFVMNSTDEEFVNNLDNYIDVESAIDYYIFGLAVCNLDGFGKNQLFLTYDGVRWYASAYDMDSTFGLYPDANGFISTNYPRESYEDFINSTGNLLYVRLANLFSERIIARWEQLRHDVLSANHIIERFESFSEVVPPYMIAEDYAGTTASGAFVNIPLKDSNNIQQIRAYTVARLAYVHEYITGESAATNLWNLEGKTQRYFTEFKFPADAITFEDGYYNGANRAGYWEPNTDKHPNLTINGNDFAVANTQSTNAGYGLGVPIDLTPGETYKISYSISGPAIVSLMYYGDDGIYIGRNELNDFKASGECETTFTIPDCKTVIFHAACDNEYDPDNPPVATYSNIEIVQL